MGRLEDHNDRRAEPGTVPPNDMGRSPAFGGSHPCIRLTALKANGLTRTPSDEHAQACQARKHQPNGSGDGGGGAGDLEGF